MWKVFPCHDIIILHHFLWNCCLDELHTWHHRSINTWSNSWFYINVSSSWLIGFIFDIPKCCAIITQSVFSPNSHNIRHPFASLWGWGMGWLSQVQPLIYILPQSLLWYRQCFVIINHVILVTDCSTVTVLCFVYYYNIISSTIMW